MQSLHTMVFDRFCEDGWTYWADVLFRRNYWEWRGRQCRVILLRINLKNFEFSKSQRKNLRKNSDLTVLRRTLHIQPMHEELFERHARLLVLRVDFSYTEAQYRRDGRDYAEVRAHREALLRYLRRDPLFGPVLVGYAWKLGNCIDKHGFP